MSRQYHITCCLWSMIVLITMTAAISGCGQTPTPTPTPEAVAAAATPAVTIIKNPNITVVSVGGEVTIAAEVTGGNLEFKWSAERGALSRTDGPSVIYTAPQSEGQDNVDVIVTSDGVSTVRTTAFTVKAPTPTPAPTPTSTSTSTPTTTPTPTPTTTPTPTNASEVTFPSPPLSPGSGTRIIELNPAAFVTQDGDGDGIRDEFFLDIHHEAIPGLTLRDGVDLSDYDLEFTFQGGDGRQVQLYYKSQNWINVYSFTYIIASGQPIRYDPFAHGRNIDEPGFDFTHIWAVGAKVWGGVEGVSMTSARLIMR